MKKTIFIIIAAVLVIGGFFAYRSFSQAQASRAATQDLETVEIQFGTLTATIDATGTVHSNQSATLAWQTAGSVSSVNVQVGDQVVKGDILAELEQTSLTQNVILAQADLYAAQEALDDLLNYETELAQAEQGVADAQEDLDNLLDPDTELELAQAQVSLLSAQETLNDKIEEREKMNYQRCLDSTLSDYEATYYDALDYYEQLAERYEREYASRPSTDPAKLLAKAELEAAEEAVQAALINVNWCKNPYTAEEIAEADADVALAQEQVDNAEELIADLEAGPDSVEIALAEAHLADAQRNYDEIKNGPSDEEIAAAEARVAAAEATLAYATIKAPFDGVITMVENKVGDQANAGVKAFRIDDLSHLLVDMEVSEIDINQIAIDQPVVLTFDAIAAKEYHGVVVEVGIVGVEAQGVVNFNVTVELTDADHDIRPGMTSAVNIIVNQITDALLVPAQAVRMVDGEPVVYVVDATASATPSEPEGGAGPLGLIPIGESAPTGARMVEITLGATSFSYYQVISGDLKAGDLILLNPPDNIQITMQGGGPFGRQP
ncbi:MAG: efflux RND transporter periplasmic adaptor subunit [Anaerolineales bacterium]|nr:efflux RND transporter periplasmic adaptor subunit [Anaerolineales bacterium]